MPRTIRLPTTGCTGAESSRYGRRLTFMVSLRTVYIKNRLEISLECTELFDQMRLHLLGPRTNRDEQCIVQDKRRRSSDSFGTIKILSRLVFRNGISRQSDARSNIHYNGWGILPWNYTELLKDEYRLAMRYKHPLVRWCCRVMRNRTLYMVAPANSVLPAKAWVGSGSELVYHGANEKKAGV